MDPFACLSINFGVGVGWAKIYEGQKVQASVAMSAVGFHMKLSHGTKYYT
jgi:hypothetical protein